MRRNKGLTHLYLELEDIWDRIKIKSLADFLNNNSTLKELSISGCDRTIFDINDFVNALKETKLKKLIVSPLQSIVGKKTIYKGMQIDEYHQERLQKIVNANGHLVIEGATESADPQTIVIRPEP